MTDIDDLSDNISTSSWGNISINDDISENAKFFNLDLVNINVKFESRNLDDDTLNYIKSKNIYLTINLKNYQNTFGFILDFNENFILFYDRYENYNWQYNFVDRKSIIHLSNKINYYDNANLIYFKRNKFIKNIINNDRSGYFSNLPNEIIDVITNISNYNIEYPSIKITNDMKNMISLSNEKNIYPAIILDTITLDLLCDTVNIDTNFVISDFISNCDFFVITEYVLNDDNIIITKFTTNELESPIIEFEINVYYNDIIQVTINEDNNNLINQKKLLHYDKDNDFNISINPQLISYSIKTKGNYLQKVKNIPIHSIIYIKYKGNIYDDYDIMGIFYGVYTKNNYNWIIMRDMSRMIYSNETYYDINYDLINIKHIKNITVASCDNLFKNNINFHIQQIDKTDYNVMTNKYAKIEYNIYDNIYDLTDIEGIIINETQSTIDLKLESYAYYASDYKKNIITIFKDKIVNINLSKYMYYLYRDNIVCEKNHKKIFKKVFKLAKDEINQIEIDYDWNPEFINYIDYYVSYWSNNETKFRVELEVNSTRTACIFNKKINNNLLDWTDAYINDAY